jgi:hypothetical protein
MFRRLLLQDLYRVRGKMFGPLHKVGLASHIRNENFGEVWAVNMKIRVVSKIIPLNSSHFQFLPPPKNRVI